MEKCFQLRLLRHWTEDAGTNWSRRLVTLIKKKRGLLSMRGSRPIAIRCCPSMVTFQAVVWSSKLLNGKSRCFVMDCDVAAAFDHVSHQLIVDAMEAMKVRPVPAWLREHRDQTRSSRFRKVIHARLTCFGAALDIPTAGFCEMCQSRKW